jgi:hypothetical protein
MRRFGMHRIPFLLYGVVLICLGTAMYLTGVLMVIPRYLFGLNRWLLEPDEWIVWYSGIPMMLGFSFALIDLFILFPGKRVHEEIRIEPLGGRQVTVALTAYNDELSIAEAVRDFQAHPLVRSVIVVSNNSTDQTILRATEAGAIVFDEPAQGYGQCVYRCFVECFVEALRLDVSEFIVLCEGDRTSRAFDLEKLLAYAPRADIVNGTRIAERLRQYTTQLSTFMYYGNLFVAKLLEAKHLGRSRIRSLGRPPARQSMQYRHGRGPEGYRRDRSQ